MQAAALLSLWREGFVEPVVPPPHPRHITAQQLLALALQEHRFGLTTWPHWWPGLSVMDGGQEVLDHLLATGYLTTDAQMAFIGAEAEATFGRRNFMELTAVFTAPPEMNVVHGRDVIGSISPAALNRGTEGQPVVLALAGRAWRVTSRRLAAPPGIGRSRPGSREVQVASSRLVLPRSQVERRNPRGPARG